MSLPNEGKLLGKLNTCKMRTSIDNILKRLQINEGMLKRSCEDLGINVYDQTQRYDLSVKAVLKKMFVDFVYDNETFFKSYQEDYYLPKCPESIAKKINRNVNEVTNYLYKEYPRCFIAGKFGLSASNRLKYVSSYEIDYQMELEEQGDNLRMDFVTWHLGYRQKTIVDKLNKVRS